jgi:23S rRNA maturation mini-RNase III
MHLVSQSRDETLLEVIASLEPLQKSLNAQKNSANFSIVTAIAKHPKTPKGVLKLFIKKANIYVQTLIASRENCDAQMQEQLFIGADEHVLEALSRNANLDKKIVKQLGEKERFAKNIAQFISLDEELFELLFEKYALVLAANESLTLEMQERLYQTQSEEVKATLGANALLQREMIEKLSKEENQLINRALYANAQTPHKILQEAYKNAANHTALAKNPNTPAEILLLLGQSEEMQILAALAKNESTPVELLYQLQLDSRFERFVKENAAFGKYIQTHNIGWMV